MKATAWRRLGAMASAMRIVALVGATMSLAQCAAVPPENAAQPSPPADYGRLISNALKKFKDLSAYSGFQISALRWVHTTAGWSWLACARYNDRGRRVFYSFFINNNAIVNARYDVGTDQCPAQQYVPFDVNGGTVGSPSLTSQSPLY
ncbi:MAG: hypothetical protein ACRECE_13055 [Xanthobacteraceae bacterium]